MGIFNFTKKNKASEKVLTKTDKREAVLPVKKMSAKTGYFAIEPAKVIIRPRITEKGSGLSSENVYTFEIYQNANKHSVREAIKRLYNVTPLRVNIVNMPSKRVFFRGKFGSKPAVKKAYVKLKAGDKIETF